jgi:hypothetical protein
MLAFAGMSIKHALGKSLTAPRMLPAQNGSTSSCERYNWRQHSPDRIVRKRQQPCDSHPTGNVEPHSDCADGNHTVHLPAMSLAGTVAPAAAPPTASGGGKVSSSPAVTHCYVTTSESLPQLLHFPQLMPRTTPA